MFQKGKQVHAPASPGAKAPFSLNSDGSVRRSSVSSTGGDKSPTDTFPTSGQRRRVRLRYLPFEDVSFDELI